MPILKCGCDFDHNALTLCTEHYVEYDLTGKIVHAERLQHPVYANIERIREQIPNEGQRKRLLKDRIMVNRKGNIV